MSFEDKLLLEDFDSVSWGPDSFGEEFAAFGFFYCPGGTVFFDSAAEGCVTWGEECPCGGNLELVAV